MQTETVKTKASDFGVYSDGRRLEHGPYVDMMELLDKTWRCPYITLETYHANDDK